MFLGGSNLAISAKSENQDLAYDLLKILVAKGYQKQFADAGHDPGAEVAARRASAAATRPSAQAKAAENSRFVPSSENWAGVEASQHPARHARRHRPVAATSKAEAAKADAAIEAHPQRLTRPARRSGSTHGEHDGPSRHTLEMENSPQHGTRRRNRSAAVGVFDRCPTSLLAPGGRCARADARLPARPAGHRCRCRSSGCRSSSAQPADWVGLDNFRDDPAPTP